MRNRISISLKNILFTLFILVCSIHSLNAQQSKSIITKFDVWFSADGEFWGESTDQFHGPNGAISAVDTVYRYAEKEIARKLSLNLVPREVEHPVYLLGGRVIGLPDNSKKEAVFAQSYDTIVQVRVTIISGGATIRGDSSNNERKQKIDMIVEILVYDKNLQRIARYKKRTRMDEIKYCVSTEYVKNRIVLNGNEFFYLFVRSLNNAFETKK